MNRAIPTFLLLAALAPLTLTGCGRGDASPGPAAAGADPEETLPSNPNVVAVPAAVRSNLGITFVRVERRRIEQTLRVPGRFEYLPTARREYRTMLPGRVELLVDQFDRVAAGDVLYRIDSPAWREHQEKLTEAQASIQRLRTRLASFGPLREAHRAHERQLGQTIAIRRERVEQLERLADAGGGRRPELVAARDAVSTAEAELTEVLETEATLEADEAEARADLAGAEARFDFLIDAASTILRVPTGALLAEDDDHPRWRATSLIEVRAETDGVVDAIDLTNGAWATQESPVLSVVRPDRLRFRASGLQSDLGVLRDGLEARIVPPTPTLAGRAIPLTATMRGELSLGLAGDPNDRTIDLFVVPEQLQAWARPGVSAQLEIVTDSTPVPVTAIPLAAVQRDGLVPVIFRRNPSNPNETIRTEADLGQDDGRWIALLSGVREGDEVVLDGAFQLMLATSGTIQKGGHFHSDGTFHEGED
jgi:multidrug efflux pump subunit AcrA (membrane-fusion protein)